MNREEMLERLKSAKTEEEVKAIAAGLNDRIRLTLDDLDHVSGGNAPESFDGMSRSELLEHIATIERVFGRDLAETVLESVVCPYYDHLPTSAVAYAYENYGEGMFHYLDTEGWKRGK